MHHCSHVLERSICVEVMFDPHGGYFTISCSFWGQSTFSLLGLFVGYVRFLSLVPKWLHEIPVYLYTRWPPHCNYWG
jgi:hypothetical protein